MKVKKRILAIVMTMIFVLSMTTPSITAYGYRGDLVDTDGGYTITENEQENDAYEPNDYLPGHENDVYGNSKNEKDENSEYANDIADQAVTPNDVQGMETTTITAFAELPIPIGFMPLSPVTDAAGLHVALNAIGTNGTGIITLASNFVADSVLDGTFDVPAGANVTINSEGMIHNGLNTLILNIPNDANMVWDAEITASPTSYVVRLDGGGNFVLNGGTVENIGTGDAIHALQGTATIDGGTVIGSLTGGGTFDIISGTIVVRNSLELAFTLNPANHGANPDFTIRLGANLTGAGAHTSPITISNGAVITLETGSHTLDVNVASSHALTVSGGSQFLLDETGGGTVNVTTVMPNANGVQVTAGSKAQVSNTTSTGGHGASANGTGALIHVSGNASGGAHGVVAIGGGQITVGGNVTTTSTNANHAAAGASGAGSSVYVTGNASAPNGSSRGVIAEQNSEITVINGDVISDNSVGADARSGGRIYINNGDVSGNAHGVVATGGGQITVGGNVTTTSTNANQAAIGADGAGSSVTITGNASAPNGSSRGIIATNTSVVTVLNGDVTSGGANSIGADARSGARIYINNGDVSGELRGASAGNDSQITIGGAIIAPQFLEVGGVIRNQDSFDTPTTLAGHFTYHNAVSNSTIWVAGTAPAVTIGTVTRTSATTATVEFTSNQAGNRFWQLDGTTPANAAALVASNQNPTAMTTTTNTISLTGLAAGQRTLYIAGNQGGSLAVSNMLTVTIPAFETSITNLAIGGVTAPAVGAAPVTADPTGGAVQWTATIAWFNNTTNAPAGANFTAGTVYRAEKTIVPQAGWTMTGVADPGFTVAEATSVTRSANVVTAVFPATAASVTVQASGDSGYGWNPPTRISPMTVPLAGDEPQIEEPQFPFIDVTVTDWFYRYVRTVWANQLFQGTSHNMFTPQGHMTRAMFVQVLANMEGVDLTAYETALPTFDDVSSTAWYFAAIEWAAGQGLVHGVGNDNFAPSAPITREQMAVMLNNYIVSRDITVPQDATRLFTDQDDISDWAVDGVLAIQAAGLITGYPDGSFNPQGTATRAEVAAIFARFLEVADLPRQE